MNKEPLTGPVSLPLEYECLECGKRFGCTVTVDAFSSVDSVRGSSLFSKCPECGSRNVKKIDMIGAMRGALDLDSLRDITDVLKRHADDDDADAQGSKTP